VETPSQRKAPRWRGRLCRGGRRAKGRKFALEPLTGETHDAPRLASGVAEFDRGHRRRLRARIGAAPGRRSRHRKIDVAARGSRRRLARAGHRAVYISGEEAVAQVRVRAERLKLQDAQIELAAETSVEDIIATPLPIATRRVWSSSTRSRPCGTDAVESRAPAR